MNDSAWTNWLTNYEYHRISGIQSLTLLIQKPNFGHNPEPVTLSRIYIWQDVCKISSHLLIFHLGNFKVVFPSKFYEHSLCLPSSPRENISIAFQILINLHSQLSLPVIDIYRLLLRRPVFAVMHFSLPALSAGRAYLLRTDMLCVWFIHRPCEEV